VHYALSVRLFSGWLAAHGLPATLDELTRSAIHEWLAELAETHVASIVWNRFKGLHRLCGWLVAEGELSVHPMVGMVAPIVVETPTPIARSLLRAHPRSKAPSIIRHYSCGIRAPFCAAFGRARTHGGHAPGRHRGRR